jgi:hypothetical protein
LCIRPDNGSGSDADGCCLAIDEGEFLSLELQIEHLLKAVGNTLFFPRMVDVAKLHNFCDVI